jgi:hypothetical protein
MATFLYPSTERHSKKLLSHFPHIHTICTLEPFISKYKILVTPVIALLTDVSVLGNLKASEAEVDHIFDHPLEAILDPSLASEEPLVSIGSDDWPYEVEYHVSLYILVHICPEGSQYIRRISQIPHCHGLVMPSIECIASAVQLLQSKG